MTWNAALKIYNSVEDALDGLHSGCTVMVGCVKTKKNHLLLMYGTIEYSANVKQRFRLDRRS